MPCLITANLYCLKAILIAVQICGIFWGWSNILRHLYCNYTANLYLVDTVHICLSFGTLCILKCFVLFQETLYMTIFLIDRYLQVEGLTLKRDQLQLVGVTAMFTACKVAYLWCYWCILAIGYRFYRPMLIGCVLRNAGIVSRAEIVQIRLLNSCPVHEYRVVAGFAYTNDLFCSLEVYSNDEMTRLVITYVHKKNLHPALV